MNEWKAAYSKGVATITLQELANDSNVTTKKIAESLNGLQEVGLIETATNTDFTKIAANVPISVTIYRPIVLYLDRKGGRNGRAAKAK